MPRVIFNLDHDLTACRSGFHAEGVSDSISIHCNAWATSLNVLPDVLAPGLDIVFCGTAASAVSAHLGAYYAGPGNAFWPTLHEVGLTPRRLEAKNYRQLLDFGLGLTDLAKNLSGSDRVLSHSDFDRDALRNKILRFGPGALAFTSKRAGKEFLGRAVEYGLQRDRIGNTVLFVLPSPSGAARGHWDIKIWQRLPEFQTT